MSVVSVLPADVDVLPFGVVVGALVELDVVIGFGDIQPAPHIDVVTVETVVVGADDVVGTVVV